MPVLHIDTPPPQTDAYVPGLGRLDAPDPRDAKFRPPVQMVQKAAAEKIMQYWIPGDLLDQGLSSKCVAFSTKALLLSSPHRQGADVDPHSMYEWCQDNDEWPGSEKQAPRYHGTSTRASMRWLKDRGFIDRYEWAKTERELFAHIMLRGPALAGIDWLEQMQDVDRWGYVRAAGYVEGGHQIMVRGANDKRLDPKTGEQGAYRLRNSWGNNWGDRGNGECWLTRSDMVKLIAARGDIALPVETKHIA